MEGAEYAKFVRGVASRLRLGSGDALLDLAAGDCASSSGMIQQLYRGSLDIMSILPSAASARRHSTQIAHLRVARHQPSCRSPVNACVSALGHLEWIPDRAFDGAVTFGALSRMRSREKLRSIFRSVLRALHPGGRFIIADASTRSSVQVMGAVDEARTTTAAPCRPLLRKMSRSRRRATHAIGGLRLLWRSGPRACR